MYDHNWKKTLSNYFKYGKSSKMLKMLGGVFISFICWFKISWPASHGLLGLKHEIRLSSCSSLRSVKAHGLNDFAINSTDMNSQEFKIYLTTLCLSPGFIFPSAGYSRISLASQSSYCSVTCVLDGLFCDTSGACMYLVHPPSIIQQIQLWYHEVAS